MSATPTARQAMSLPIKTKIITISDPIEMPEFYSSTPGGTIYSTTPNGTKFTYDRAYLRELRNSPLSQSPPNVIIPSNLRRGAPRRQFRKCVPIPVDHVKKNKSLKIDEQEQFQLEL